MNDPKTGTSWPGLWKMAALAVLALSGTLVPAGEAPQYNRDVRPILAENCFACHGPDSAARKAGLRLDRREDALQGEAIVPGQPDKSSVIERIVATEAGQIMPPKKTRKTLTAAQKDTLCRWVAAGAVYQPHWSLLAPQRPPLAAVKNVGWVRTPVDRFILAELEKHGLTPAPEADRRTLARRLSLDLIGLPPDPAEVETFVQDQAPDANERYVERLLQSPHWGEHRGRYWLDVARYADTHGIHFDNFREIWAYRDWVIDAFNQNKPFDLFTIEQLAGDLLPNRTLDQQVATGFNRCNITTNEGGVIPEEYAVFYTRDRTETTAQVWLGMTANCAVCHDHKFDPISQREFYELAAFFNNTTQGVMDGNVKDTPPTVLVPQREDRPRWEALAKELDKARRNPDPKSQELAKRLAALQKEEAAIKARGTVAHIMQEKAGEPMSYLLFRGEYDKRRDALKPNTPRTLPPLPPDLPRNRLGLAQWLVRPEHPLTARVTVNRFWQEVFGTGLVRTCGDFGVSGELPSHPELLDWLAVEFRESGWDVKRFFKLLVSSATYRQAALTTPEKREADPQNRLLSRGPRFRMDAEMVRDYALAASGLLVRKIGGPSVRPYQPEGVWEAVAMIGSNTRDYRRDSGDNLYRRSLYTFWKRSAPPASMEIFNAPSRETCTVRRERTDTPLQALVTLNDPQFIEAARFLGQAALKAGDKPEKGLDFLARRLLARPLRPEEEKIVQHGLADLLVYYKEHPEDAKKLLAVGEAKADPPLDSASLAAWTMFANELLNLDEVLNK